jgi:hypothetical protein
MGVAESQRIECPLSIIKLSRTFSGAAAGRRGQSSTVNVKIF